MNSRADILVCQNRGNIPADKNVCPTVVRNAGKDAKVFLRKKACQTIAVIWIVRFASISSRLCAFA
jgi:hypothetical protein